MTLTEVQIPCMSLQAGRGRENCQTGLSNPSTAAFDAPHERRQFIKRFHQIGLFVLIAAAAVEAAVAGTALSPETILYAFPASTQPKGGSPQAGLTGDGHGNLYGTTSGGGQFGAGEVFKVQPNGHLTVVYSFTGGADGGSPYSSLVIDSKGTLYGTTLFGGTGGAGVVFRLDTRGRETVLHDFTGAADGGFPYTGLVMDSVGNLYGTTSSGG